MADRVEGEIVFYPATNGARRSGRKGLKARSEKGRHNGEERKREPVQDGEVDG